jgi:DeoR/GlpR family transcriptional regulator of sugar metabolism
MGSPATANFSERQDQASSAKAAIARTAAHLIRDGQVVLMDGGTTNIQVAQQLPRELHATIITNSPPLTVALENHPHIEVIMLGGQLFKHSMVTLGAATLKELQMVRADIYLLGVASLHPEVGISTGNLEEAYLKRAMIDCAAEVIGLASPEKLNTAAPYIVGELRELSEIITERTVSDEVLEPYKALGISITRA